ncbi:hypothetical protein EVAR_10114_1 [Eumeta japonica]|uniref:Uncharacterized protein n=1 Tax=Eumeta variegata TaxID=151549 RepID=A0A4C1UC04_EUMVA|nr:hypothetical protein EVAR_10114_1 [Eumeta japonica]
MESWRKATPVYRVSAIRVASAFCTISEEAVCVITGILPLRVLVKERRTLYQKKRSTTLTPEEFRTEEQRLNQNHEAAEDAKCVFSVCSRFNPQRDELEKILNKRFKRETLVEAMLSSKAAWNTTSMFATEVLTDLRSVERKRAK